VNTALAGGSDTSITSVLGLWQKDYQRMEKKSKLVQLNVIVISSYSSTGYEKYSPVSKVVEANPDEYRHHEDWEW